MVIVTVPLVALKDGVIVVRSMPPVMVVSAHTAVFAGLALTVAVATALMMAVITVASVAGSLYMVFITILLMIYVLAMFAVTGPYNRRRTRQSPGIAGQSGTTCSALMSVSKFILHYVDYSRNVPMAIYWNRVDERMLNENPGQNPCFTDIGNCLKQTPFILSPSIRYRELLPAGARSRE